MKLDCRNNSFEYVPAELGEYALLLVDSRVKHGLASTAYNKRRQECQQGLTYIQKQFPRIRSLRDADMRILIATQKLMPETIFKRLRYVAEENDRVQQVAQALAKGDLEQVGACMFATHEGLKHGYEVSCAEVDLLVDIAKSMPYVLGSRIMGGGFGGCTINLLQKSEIPAFTKLVAAQYQTSSGKEAKFYEVKITNGGHFLKH
jgi:galactokinase